MVNPIFDTDKARLELKAAIQQYSFREDHDKLFTLASGKQSPYYFDLKQTLLQPRYLKLAAGLLLQSIHRYCPHAKAAGGLTMGADPLTYAITMADNDQGGSLLPLVVRKQAKDHGSKKPVEGALSMLQAGDPVLLLEDVITTGMSALLAYEVIVSLGFQISHCFAVLDRDEGGRGALQQRGIELHTLFTIDDFRSRT